MTLQCIEYDGDNEENSNLKKQSEYESESDEE